MRSMTRTTNNQQSATQIAQTIHTEPTPPIPRNQLHPEIHHTIAPRRISSRLQPPTIKRPPEYRPPSVAPSSTPFEARAWLRHASQAPLTTFRRSPPITTKHPRASWSSCLPPQYTDDHHPKQNPTQTWESSEAKIAAKPRHQPLPLPIYKGSPTSTTSCNTSSR